MTVWRSIALTTLILSFGCFGNSEEAMLSPGKGPDSDSLRGSTAGGPETILPQALVFEPRIIVMDGKKEFSKVSSFGPQCWFPSSLKTILGGPPPPQCSSNALNFEYPSQLEKLEEHAFQRTSLKSIVFPASVVVLEAFSFSCCDSLSSVIFESGSSLSRIEGWTFFETDFEKTAPPSPTTEIARNAFLERIRQFAPLADPR
ncbi:MAG: leucine-rich repeat domain-containing protein [Holosporales bacterium]|jgi:hypothetical protein|nr:leucine-rich repeat domain-containing protein [Holosporales bacterium]